MTPKLASHSNVYIPVILNGPLRKKNVYIPVSLI